MTRQEISDKLFDLLVSENDLSIHWTQKPLVMHLPFMGKRDEFFLEVALFHKDDQYSHNALISECLHVAGKIISTMLLTDEKGIEIAVYITSANNPQRICRLIVLDKSFEKLLKAKTIDILFQRIDGITFQTPTK